MKNIEQLTKLPKDEFIVTFYADNDKFNCTIDVYRSIIFYNFFVKGSGGTTYERMVFADDDDAIVTLENIRTTHLLMTDSKRFLFTPIINKEGKDIELRSKYSIDKIVHIIRNSMITVWCDEEE